jgi:septal ring factor EnvC (AmiA/AmiB activator)
MLKKILVLKLLLLPCAHALDAKLMNHNINQLGAQIKQVNQDLSSKIQQQQRLDAALAHSQGVLKDSAALLQQLQAQREFNLQQALQLKKSLAQLSTMVKTLETQLKVALQQLYLHQQQLRHNASEVLTEDSKISAERKKIYLLALWQAKQQDYMRLNNKVLAAQALSRNLELEIQRLDKQIQENNVQHQRLVKDKTYKQQQQLSVVQQIANKKQQLNYLQQRQLQLNHLLEQITIAQKEHKHQLKANKTAGNILIANEFKPAELARKQSGAGTAAAADLEIRADGLTFFNRNLVKPISGTTLLGFGQMRDNVRNNGMLIAVANNSPVFAVSKGTVLFSGELPNFGQIIVIDNGDNYTSVYSGIVSKVAKGSMVNAGQIIAHSGELLNQPMGGVYFELRHLGKPVNPSRLF